MMSDWHGISVTIERAQLADDAYDPNIVASWQTHAVVDGVVFDPGGSYDVNGYGREGVASEPRLLRVPIGTDVKPADRVVIPGETNRYEVVGTPARHIPPWHTTWSPGQVLKLRKVEG